MGKRFGKQCTGCRWVRSLMTWPFTPENSVPGTPCIRSWLGPREVWTLWRKQKYPFPCRESNPHHLLTTQGIEQDQTRCAPTAVKTCVVVVWAHIPDYTVS